MEIPAALLFFNVGVEVGQIIFVGAILGLFWGVTRVTMVFQAVPANRLLRFEKPLAYAVGSMAMYWTTQRVLSFWG